MAKEKKDAFYGKGVERYSLRSANQEMKENFTPLAAN